jgi:thimet oligopeptidase
MMVKLRLFLAIAPFVLFTACSTMSNSTSTPAAPTVSATPASFAAFQQGGGRFRDVVTLPEFETTPEAVKATLDRTIATANAALDGVGGLAPGQVTFANTVGALDDLLYPATVAANRLALVKETSTNAAVRDAATEALKTFQEWAVGLEYREDVYRAVQAYADTKPPLAGEEAKLLAEALRDYRRAGLALPKAERDEVERWRKELAGLATDFESNVTKAQAALKFTRAELAGVPQSLLGRPGVKTGDDEYTIQVNVTWQYLSVMEHAKREDVRRRVLTAQHRLAMRENIPLLEKILVLRDTIARKLGYASWADYQLEVKMAKTAATAVDFERRLVAGLQPKFDAELAEFQQLKAAETGDPKAEIHLWDWRYFANELKVAKYNVDAEQLRVYFPMQRVLDGMFAVYQRIFGLKFQRVEPPYKWVDDLQLWAVADAATGEPLGLFYLDLFPRAGKYNHFAVFPIIDGKRQADGRYQRPVVSLVCNFPPPSPDAPSLLQHSDVETLFHEFGHAMHGILTRARFARFAGANVPRDFVEAPSQMLENWVWDKRVLDSFAADYRDPAKKIPPEILGQLKAAKFATYGSHYRRQLAFGLLDLTYHTQINAANAGDAVALGNRVLDEVFLPVPPATAMPAYFGHLMGYDAGYYGYAWADAIAADMATVFEQAPDGYFDTQAGRRLRDEVYAVGDSRDANVTIERFLGRPRSLEPFLKKIGVASAAAKPAP